jgi:hypothetical protein
MRALTRCHTRAFFAVRVSQCARSRHQPGTSIGSSIRDDGEDDIMHSITRIVLWAGSTLTLVGTAVAADMTGAEMKAFLLGKTIYLETTAASASGKAGQGVIYWSEDGTALYKTPSGSIMHGKSDFKGNTNCTDWKERPGTSCTRYDKQGDVITVIDAKSGEVRAKIVKTAPGNAEKLAP